MPSVDKVRLVSSGTEAGMTAVRLARGATGRPKILKFAGCYHGHTDALLVAAGSGVATLGIPGSAGVTAGTVADTIVVPYNDEAALDAAFASHGAELAAVLVEPIAANMGLVAPAPGFLDGLRRRCTAAGALLVFDEVITGFRVGRAGAQGMYDITPDLSMFGKVVGGGLPLAAIGGRADVMDELAPLGPVYQAGTLSGNPFATAAGLAALAQLDDDAYVELTARATRFAVGLRDAFASTETVRDGHAGRHAHRRVLRVGPRHQLRAGAGLPTTIATRRFFHALLAGSDDSDDAPRVFFAPSGYETLFVSLAHSDADLDQTFDAVAHAASHDSPDLTTPRSRNCVTVYVGQRATQFRRRGGAGKPGGAGYSSSWGRRLRRTRSMKKRLPPMQTTITTISTNASPPPPFSPLASTSCCAEAGAARATSATRAEHDGEGDELDASHGHTFAGTGAGRGVLASASAASASISSFSRQCSMRSPRPNRIDEITNTTNGGRRTEPRSRVRIT